MPHSSGGGSHGGGGHSGGSHSSSSSWGGSSRGGAPNRRISKTYFPHARTFVCYNHGRTNYIYSNFDAPEKPKETKKTIKQISVCLAAGLVLILIWMIVCAVPAAKITAKYNTNIVIEDTANVLDDDGSLYDTLSAFYEETGITPAVITVHNEDWNQYYMNLESYAYNLYVNHFPDEYHWLIVYSEPTTPDSKFNDWYWEGMQGDNTDRILTEDVVNNFNRKLQKYLTADSQYNVSNAIKQAFNDTTPTIRQFKIISAKNSTPILLVIMSLIGLAMLWIQYAVITFQEKDKKYIEITKVPKEEIQEENCEYCGGLYIKGQHLTCPHCGAVIKAKREQKERDS